MTFLLTLFFIYIAYQIGRRLVGYLFRRKVRRMYRDAFESFGQSRPNRARGGGPRTRFGKDVGEYVDFEEIECERQVETTTVEETLTESRYVDVEWEDIP